jgi:MFS transporter, AAHS family, 4-hydroxybenzoate transporter
MAETKTVDIAELLESQEPTWFAAFIFALCCLVMFADGYDNQAINYAAPAIIKEWGISTAAMTPVFNISIIGWITGSMVFGMLADRVGRRPATILAVLTFGAFTLAIPAARNLVELSILRFCAAFGVGGGMPMAIALVSDYAKAKRRAFFVTLLFLGYTAGASGGGLLAAEIVPEFGWRAVFYVGGVGGLAIAPILLIGLPESVRYLVLRHPADVRILRYAQNLRPRAGFNPSTSFAIGESVREGIPVKHLFAQGRAAMTVFLWLALGFAFMTHFFLSQWLTTLLTPELGFADAARAQAFFQAGSAFAFVFGYLVDKKGVPVTTLAMIFAAIPVATVGIAAAAGAGVTMATTFAAGVLVLGGDVAISAFPTMLYPTYMRSTATGATFGVARLGAVLGPMIAGLLIALGTPLGTIFLLGALPVLASGAACFLLDRSITPEAARHMAARTALSRQG